MKYKEQKKGGANRKEERGGNMNWQGKTGGAP